MNIDDQLLKKLENYRMPEPAKELIRRTKIVFLVGIAGAGKDAIINELLKSGQYHYIVSHTTRVPRQNMGVMEEDGVHYHFIDFARAEAMLDNQEFIEAKFVHGSNIYGTSIAEIQKAKNEAKIPISEIEVQGIAEYRTVSDTVLPVFILPPDFETWQKRLQNRYGGKLDEADFKKRLETAKEELQEALDKDYYEFVVNKDLEETVSVVDKLAHGQLSSEKNEQARNVAKELLKELEKIS